MRITASFLLWLSCVQQPTLSLFDTGYIHINVQEYTIYVYFNKCTKVHCLDFCTKVHRFDFAQKHTILVNVQIVLIAILYIYVQKVRNMCLGGVIWGTSTWPDGTGITAMYMAGDLLAFNSRRRWAVRWVVSAAAQGMLRSKGRDIKVLCVVIRDGAFHPNRSKIQGYKHKISVLPWPTRSMQGGMRNTHKSTECTKMTIILLWLTPGPDTKNVLKS